MEVAFLFKIEEKGVYKNLMARLHAITPDRYVLALPKWKDSLAHVADFLDSCPGIDVRQIDKTPEHADLVCLNCVGSDWGAVVEEVCNAINDVFDADITIPRSKQFPHAPFMPE